eukprot:1910981-Rhodomonas_salina.1
MAGPCASAWSRLWEGWRGQGTPRAASARAWEGAEGSVGRPLSTPPASPARRCTWRQAASEASRASACVVLLVRWPPTGGRNTAVPGALPVARDPVPTNTGGSVQVATTVYAATRYWARFHLPSLAPYCTQYSGCTAEMRCRCTCPPLTAYLHGHKQPYDPTRVQYEFRPCTILWRPMASKALG